MDDHAPAPRRSRYAVIVGVAVAVLVLFLGTVVTQRLGFFTPSDPPEPRAFPGRSLTVDLAAGTETVVYSDSSDTGAVRCRVTGNAEVPVTFERVLNPFTLDTDQGTWHAAVWVHAESANSYQISCTGMSGSWGVGDVQRPTRYLDTPWFLVGVPVVALAGGVVAFVLGRRGRPRRRPDVDFYLS